MEAAVTRQAHGKIILIGEHSVVYNQPAIALPFTDVAITAIVTPADRILIDCAFYQGELKDMPEFSASLKELITAILEHLKQEQATFALTLTSTIPIERGMGSSAAVAVATTRALFAYFHAPLTDELLLKLVNIAETIAHGKPSGIDAYMTSHSSAYLFQLSHTPQLITVQMDASLIVADTGITGQTKQAIAQVKNKLKNNPSAKIIIEQLGTLTLQAKQALETNDKIALGNYLTKAHYHLAELGISLPLLDTLVQTALDAGAYGAKLTGGGLGGCMIAIAEPTQVPIIQAKLQQNGAKQTWHCPLKGNYHD